MNGIVGAYNATKEQTELIESYKSNSEHVYYKSANCIIKAFYPKGRMSKIKMFRDVGGSTDVIVFGDIFLGEEIISSQPMTLMNREKRHNFNGEFIAILIDKQNDCIEIYIDQNYATPLFYSNYAQSLVFSSYMSAVHQLAGSPNVMYEKSVHDFLAYGNCLGDDTFFECIKRIPSQYGIEYKNNHISKYKYSIEKEEYYGNAQEAKDDIMQALINAIRKRLTSNKIAVSMSGGMDSRFMLGILKKHFEDLDISGYMWSQSGSHELEIARKSCEAVNVEFKPIILSPNDFIQDFDGCCEFHGGNDYIFQSFALKTGEALSRVADLVFTGFYLDVTLGCTFADTDMMQASTIDEHMLQSKRKAMKTSVFSKEDIERAAKKRLNLKKHEHNLFNEFSKFSSKENFTRVQNFVFSNRAENLVINRDFVPRQFVEYAYPSVDLAFRRIMNKIPYSVKNNHKLYRELFIEEFPELAQIDYFNTGLPITVPIEYWAKASAIEAQRERLFNDLFYNEDKSFEYTHYYSNYNQWISSNQAWKNCFESIIYSDDAVIFKTVFDKEYVRKMYDDHINGRANNRKKLVSVITLQRIMQYYGIESVK